jgi:hypothetical protein
MGLDIYFHKLKNNDNLPADVYSRDDWAAIRDEEDKQSSISFRKVYNKSIKDLQKAESENYDKVYNRVIKRFCKFSNYPQFDYEKLGVEYDYKTRKYSYTPVSVDVFIAERGNILQRHCSPHIAYFRKVNFVYAYFAKKLIDEVAWVTKRDLEDLIDRCGRVLKDHSLAETLLPTQCGFFFGSTDYDEWYFYDVNDCKKQMERILKNFKDNELMYVAMSW